MKPTVVLANYTELSKKQLNELQDVIGRNMSSATLGKDTLEILDVSQHGVWLYWTVQEHFLSYEHFPWFKESKVKEILNVVEEAPEHLHWPDLDIDLNLAMILEPEKYPLIAK